MMEKGLVLFKGKLKELITEGWLDGVLLRADKVDIEMLVGLALNKEMVESLEIGVKTIRIGSPMNAVFLKR